MSNSNHGSPMYQSHSLSRSNTFTRMNVSPKCFGTSQYIHKEEHERECKRWQAKLDEAEEKLAEASVNNSDMLQIKAELNKKIVELEKNQKPLIELNKRLSDRNRIIQQELKKVEERLCHAQDDFLTLKDAYSRLFKENTGLKEQRAFPEKVKELDRYRNQVLEYSKCINALRQSGLEKDRRYDLLVQKFKRMKKCFSKRSDDDDRQSSYGSEGSAESSINLDTITEDIDEALEIDHHSSYDHEVTMKLNALAFGEELLLKEQLEAANCTIAELQAALASCNNTSHVQEQYDTKIEKQTQRLQSLQKTCDALQVKLANSEEHNDLLEFQILELREMSNHAVPDTEDKAIETDIYISGDDAESIFEDIKAFVKMDVSAIEETKEELKKLGRLACLKLFEREIVKKSLQHIENLENKLSFAETELNMTNCELRRLETVKNGEIVELRRQLNEVEAGVSKKKKELKAELENARKECVRALNSYQDKQKQTEALEKSVKNLEQMLVEKEAQNIETKNEIAKLTSQAADSQSHFNLQLNSLQQQHLQNTSIITQLTEELTKLKEVYSLSIQEKEKLEAEMIRNQEAEKLKEEKLMAEVKNLKSQLSAVEETLNTNNTAFSKQLKELKDEKEKILKEKEETKEELKKMALVLETTHDECIYKVAKAEKDAAAALENSRNEFSCTSSLLKEEQAKTEQELVQARAEIEALKAQLRPIGSQLERRYEETKYRLQEANNLNHKYEEMLKAATFRISDLEVSKQDVQGYLAEIQQLKAYNHELEDQFNSQMEIISALKKKFLLLNNNSSSENDDTWPKMTAQAVSSIDDEQYHSEGSSSVGSYNVVQNKV